MGSEGRWVQAEPSAHAVLSKGLFSFFVLLFNCLHPSSVFTPSLLSIIQCPFLARSYSIGFTMLYVPILPQSYFFSTLALRVPYPVTLCTPWKESFRARDIKLVKLTSSHILDDRQRAHLISSIWVGGSVISHLSTTPTSSSALAMDI